MPGETTTYLHARLLKWEGTSSVLYQMWMQHTILQRNMLIKWCPHSLAIRKVVVKTRKRASRLSLWRRRMHVFTLQQLIERSETCGPSIQDFIRREETSSDVLQDMTREYQRLCAVKPVERPALNPHEPFDEALAELEHLRERYFDVIRRRRSGHVSHAMPSDARLTELRTLVAHTRQEQEARRLQNCNFHERVDVHMRLEQLEHELETAVDAVKDETRARLEEETRAEMVELSTHILESSQRIDAMYGEVKRHDEQVRAYEYMSVKERLRRLEENICMFREDRDNADDRIQRLTVVIQERSVIGTSPHVPE